jgi:hypothetical protein
VSLAPDQTEVLGYRKVLTWVFDTLDFIDPEPPTVEFCDTVLEKADPTRLPRTLSVGILTILNADRSKLAHFDDFVTRFEVYLEKTAPHKVEPLLRRFKR